MAIVDNNHRHSHRNNNKWPFCPLWQSSTTSSSSVSSTQDLYSHMNSRGRHDGNVAPTYRSSTVSSVARSLLPARRRLRLDPSNSLFFPYEPGKQVRSAVAMKNFSKSHVAFKFQTTAPKSCYMRPPAGVLAPGESLIATVFKFVEQSDNIMNQKSKIKFKIMSLKVKEGTDYVPELFDEQRNEVTVECVLRAVFLDPERANPALEKLNRQLADADAAVESRKKPAANATPHVVGEGLVIDEWKVRREKYLARQQVKVVD